MTRSFLSSLAFGTALLLSACGSQSGEDHDQAASGSEAARQINPFASLERQANQRMMAAVGTDAGDSWVRKMIEHHQHAINMSRVMLEQNPSEDVTEMVRATIDEQSKEIADLRTLIKDGAPHQASAELYRVAVSNMQQAMLAATGADVEETFLRKMLAHHEGGVALSNVALETGVSGAVRSQVVKTRQGQQKEAAMVEALLRGEPMPGAQSTLYSAPATSAPEARSRPAPTGSPASSPTARPQAAPAPAETANPHAGHNMSGQ